LGALVGRQLQRGVIFYYVRSDEAEQLVRCTDIAADVAWYFTHKRSASLRNGSDSAISTDEER
jgi:hypothetical protein